VDRGLEEVTHLRRVVGERPKTKVLRRDVALGEHPVAHPVDEPAPVVRSHQHHRELADLVGLDQRERLPQLVHRPEAAREDHEPAGVADEHDLAYEEVVELERDVAVGVAALLERQLDVQAHRQRTGVLGATVGGLHQARAAARDDRHAALSDDARGLAREGVVGVVGLCAGRAEEAGRGAHARQGVEPHADLFADAVYAVLVGQRGADRRFLRGDDLLVKRAGLARHEAPEARWPALPRGRPPRFPLPPRRKVRIGTSPLKPKTMRPGWRNLHSLIRRFV